MKLFAFAGSLRKDSLNFKLTSLAASVASRSGQTVDLVPFKEFEMPCYDGDIEASTGIPEGANRLKDKIIGNHALIIATPTYNYSVPGTLKNAVDWVSRHRPMPFSGKPVLLLGASPSPLGSLLGIFALRSSLEGLGCLVFPTVFSLVSAEKAFDASGSLVEKGNAERLEKLVKDFLVFAGKFS